MKTTLLSIFFVTITMVPNLPLYALFRLVEKTTAGAANVVEKTTKAIVPPAEKIVKPPLEVVKKTTKGIADAVEGTDDEYEEYDHTDED